MRRLLAFALALAACRGRDQSDRPAGGGATASLPAARGPDALLLRVPRAGGVARVVAYPNVDSTIWTATDASPALDHVLAFDADAGLIAAIDARGLPLWLDLRIGTVTVPSRGKMRGLTSVDGSTIYGVGADGAILRFTPAGNWVFKPAQAARAVFPQTNGTLLVHGGRGDGSRAWRIHPPENRFADSVLVPNAGTGVGAPLGDRVYFTQPPRNIVGLDSRTLSLGRSISFDHAVRVVATTPSGDRAYIVTDSSNTVFVVDRYQDRVTSQAELPGRPRDLRVDPFGRFVLVRPASGDSVWVVSIGTDRVVETLHSQWRSDLPLVAIDGAVVLADGADVVIHTARGERRVAGGASDFWYPFIWNGLRARAASLDRPVNFASDSDTTVHPPAPVAETTAVAPPPPVDSAKLGFTVSFAALLDEARAREQAAKISVNGQQARVVTGMTNGTAIYRVVLGPFPTRDEAERAGRASGQTYLVYPGSP